MSGWIKLHRNLIDWEWYDDHNTTRLFIHCLVRANFEARKWKGISIARGQFWTSIPTLCSETGLSTSQIRTSLNKLKLTGELTVESQAQGRMVTVLEYDQYQADDRQVDSPVTDQSQTNDRPMTANKNLRTKEVKKEIKNSRFAPPSVNAISDYMFSKCQEAKVQFNQNEADKFFNYYESNGWKVGKNKMKCWKAAASGWLKRNVTNENNQRPNQPRRSSVVDRAHEAAARRERERQAREGMGQAMDSPIRDIRPPASQPIRGDDTGELGAVINGDYTRSD